MTGGLRWPRGPLLLPRSRAALGPPPSLSLALGHPRALHVLPPPLPSESASPPRPARAPAARPLPIGRPYTRRVPLPALRAPLPRGSLLHRRRHHYYRLPAASRPGLPLRPGWITIPPPSLRRPPPRVAHDLAGGWITFGPALKIYETTCELTSRIRRRLVLEYAARDELLACLDHLLDAAGNATLMTTELKATLADHAAGNYRVLMNLGDELLAIAADRDLPRLDEKLFLESFQQPARPKAAAQAKKR